MAPEYRNIQVPPLKDSAGRLGYTTEEKQSILVQELLTNKAEVGDIPTTAPTVPSCALPWAPLTSREVKESILGKASTAPGEDELVTGVFKVAWPRVSNLVFSLFKGCLDAGYHPKCFRSAIVAIIPKPNKKDKSSPRAYRPISLLSVLGKGLERLLAK